ncbi:phospholipase A2-like [Arctopsyche grandis]|uniref:phospholipase A2-like n=1 Tax=Arctopsyche grandis TaxID=121162 RepID=UPI00406D99E2
MAAVASVSESESATHDQPMRLVDDWTNWRCVNGRDVCLEVEMVVKADAGQNDAKIGYFIFPGTNWCGPGNIASNYHDIGNWTQTDTCCRNHDYCDDIIPSGHSAHGLVNNDFYTKLSCSCDEKFLNCLHKSEDGLGNLIGKVYFNGIGTQCFKNEFPIVKCKQTRGFLLKKCVEYELDYTKPKLYQWFDVPPYI